MAYGEHDYEDDFLIGLYAKREEAEAKAAERPPSNARVPGQVIARSWEVEEHEVHGA